MIRKLVKNWRDSASLIVLARHKPTTVHEKYNYKVLMFTRTAKTANVDNSAVFPGGAFDKQDAAPGWNSLFSERALSADALKRLTLVDGSRPYMFQTDCEGGLLDRNLSLRLCALREAFEELGILLVAGDGVNGYSRYLQSFDVDAWQRRIHDGKDTFRDLHVELGSAPDLLNLYEWSCWLTPTMFRKRRFETVFYMAALNEQPAIHPEEHEVDKHLWDTPAGLLEAHRTKQLWLAPPQMYELTRLSYLYDIDQIVRFAAGRNRKGSTLFCPVQYNTADGLVFVLPGDELYPANYDCLSNHADVDRYGELTREQMRQSASRLHRVEHRGLYHQEYFLNQVPLDGHLHIGGDNGHLVGL